tara:strand:- start:4338 stop:4556 length:219 start_codon:yes stop_codon:yes gene_type:complete
MARKYIKPGAPIDIGLIANALNTDRESLLKAIESDPTLFPAITGESFVPYDTKILDAIERAYRGYVNSYKAA